MKKSKWIKKRHRIITIILRPFLKIYLRLAYRCKFEGVIKTKTPHLILYNHQTSMDQFMIGVMFKKQIYYMATEDLFSKGNLSKLIKWLVNPIAKSKSVQDMTAIRTCIQVAKEGGNIAIAPEGNRTYSGKICNIDDGIAKLAKLLKLDLVIINIVGGYAVEPRWGVKKRKGKMRVFVNTIIKKEELSNYSTDELYKLIVEKLNVEQYETNQTSKSNSRAEKLERVLYMCPKCGKYHTIKSKGNYIFCTNCDLKLEYNEHLKFVNCNQEEKSPFVDVNEWWKYQEKEISNKSMQDLEQLSYCDDNIKFMQTIVAKKKVPLGVGKVSMNLSAISVKTNIDEFEFKMADILAIACCGKHKMNIYLRDNSVYQIKGQEDYNPVKYMQFYYHFKNLSEGGITHDEFLGI